MSLLVLHRNPLGPFPYDRWLRDASGGTVLLAARDRVLLAGEELPTGNGPYRHREFLDTFDDGDAVVARALDLAGRHAVHRIVALHEGDLELAARLREKLGLPGARLDEIRPYRDKVLMKARAAAVGVKVAPHSVPGGPADVEAFAARHGLPLVLKDRDGFGSRGLRIARTPGELTHAVGQAFDGSDAGPGPLLEAFVPGRMCHVDGLVAGGRMALAWPSQYQYDLASFGADPSARVDVTLEPDDPLTWRLLALAEQVLAALGGPPDHAFHLEVFHTPDDHLVLCEIAARPGGARIREVFAALFGVNQAEWTVRAEAGLVPPPLPAPEVPGGRVVPRRMAGQVLLMKRPGLVRSVPEPDDGPGVEFYGVFARPGQLLDTAAGSADFLAAAVLSASTREECEVRLRSLGARFETETEIVPNI